MDSRHFIQILEHAERMEFHVYIENKYKENSHVWVIAAIPMDRTAFIRIMAKNRALLACLVIMVLDIAAGVLGIQAEIEQNRVQHLKVWIFECRDPSNRAFNLGLAAVAFLALAQAVANLSGGCVFVRSKEELQRSPSNRQLAAASLILSWVMFAIGFILLISGALANSGSRRNCGIDNRRFLSFGGILCFVHGLFAVAYCVSADAVVQEQHRLNQTKLEVPS